MDASTLLENLGRTLGDHMIAAIFSSVLTAGMATLHWWLAKRLPARRMWRFSDANSLVIVVSSSAVVDTGIYHRPTTGVGQVRALALLASSLTRAYRAVDLERVRMSAQDLGHEIEKDLLILGGSKTNACAGLILRCLADRVPFQVQGTSIDWGGTIYDGIASDGRIVRDFGYVVRAPNPFSPNSKVVIIGGSHTYGTVAAARWWSEHGGRRSIPEEVAVLVGADVVPGEHVAPPQVLEQSPLL